MEGKDNRSRDKRHKMKTHYRNKKKHAATSSSSEQMDTTNCSVVDVIDSSDEPYMDVPIDWMGRGKAYSKAQFKSRLHDMPPDENEENEQMLAGDFKLMSQVPAAIGGHFKFASEKRWETAETEEFLDNTEASEYFTLNLKLLNAGLQSIPFYKRLDYTAGMFTKSQLLAMEEEAETAEKSYQHILREHLENPQLKGRRKSANGQRPTTANVVPPAKTGESRAEDELDELDELLNLSTNQIQNIKLKTEAANQQLNNNNHLNNNDLQQLNATTTANSAIDGNQKDIQEWLDNVLDE